ncbi:hypothetical protein DNTS_021871 [Danionella cerebrum]|uniref:Uncharacterized protein n=1 Tax=Danionella cerebrum TaxID=2873325 RepID=A0A553RKC1_9TELE|nr:hypothetical protein DNTS_021871 [Danionella translucida]
MERPQNRLDWFGDRTDCNQRDRLDFSLTEDGLEQTELLEMDPGLASPPSLQPSHNPLLLSHSRQPCCIKGRPKYFMDEPEVPLLFVS